MAASRPRETPSDVASRALYNAWLARNKGAPGFDRAPDWDHAPREVRDRHRHDAEYVCAALWQEFSQHESAIRREIDVQRWADGWLAYLASMRIEEKRMALKEEAMRSDDLSDEFRRRDAIMRRRVDDLFAFATSEPPRQTPPEEGGE